ncbi:MAG: efflux RND transporter periplasmic adaptor subunit [Bacteroidales bacterium]
MKTIWNKYKWYMLLLGAGILLGWVFFHSPGSQNEPAGDPQANLEVHEHEDETGTVWTCSMHPQIRQDQPGKCPICGMDLIPVSSIESNNGTTDPAEIPLSESAAKLADIQTWMVTRESPVKEIFLQGKVEADERRIAELTARFGGRIEKLYVSFTGENVRKGQPLATIYSPELITAQRELLEAVSYADVNPSLYNAARAKLKLWDLTEEQIDGIEEHGEPLTYFDILSPISGTVTKRNVALGDYLKEGSELFEVTDLSHVWIMFDAYESDLPWIREGDQVTYTIQSLPGKKFKGKVKYIDPLLDPATRVAKARVEQSNPDLSLKPEMFANGTVESSHAGNSKDILVPKTSILWTGKRAVVYVKVPGRDQPTFIYREIDLGPESGEYYVVAGGLAEGEEIAVNGVFKIDAAAQLAGKPSMMNPEGGKAALAHDHSAMAGMEVQKATDHNSMVDDQNQKPTIHSGNSAEPVSEGIAPAFRKQLQNVYEAYILMKNAYVASDAAEIMTEARKVKSSLGSVDMELLQGDAHMKWMEYLNTMNSSISTIAGKQDLSAQRVAFATFNDAFYHAIETFGLAKDTVYYQYCPMANGDQGAFWLSEIKEIRNPYFGDEMLGCGETRETLAFE